MDKGLKKLKELELKLSILKSDKSKNEEEIKKVENEKKSINDDMQFLQKQLNALKEDKDFVLNTPKYLKKYKRNLFLICILIVLMSVVSVTGLQIAALALKKALSINKVLVAFKLSLLSIPITTIWGVVQYHIEKKDRNEYKLENIEKQLQEKTKELELKKSEEKKNTNNLKRLNEININLENEIAQVLKEKSFIEEIRNKVIKDFCTDNSELDKLLNDACDKEIKNTINDKQKVKRLGSNK